MKRSTLVMVLCLVLAVAMGVGSTMAYLQDTDEDVNVMTLGSVYITQNEQERDADGNLVPFTQEKPVYPAVGPIEWAETGKGVVVNDIEYKVFSDELQNVVDKIVTVTNTGKSDAYIRTIIAIEAPNYDPTDLIHFNYNETDVTMSAPVCFTRDGVDYVCFSFTYPEALAPQETSAPSLVQLFLDSKATNADVEKFGDTWEVLVLSQAVQTQGFTDAETALNTAFEEVNAENVAKWFGADFGQNIGSPGKDWPNNNPPSADVWDGTIPETMPETLELTLDPVKKQGGTITVNDAEALVYLSKLKNDFIAKAEEIDGYDNYYYHWEWKIELARDIDMNNIAIDPIDIIHFGSFDGNGHIITNVVVKDGGSGLFNTDASSNFANLTIANIKVNANATSDQKAGALGGYVGALENVIVTNADIKGGKYVGGIAGKSASVNNCTIKNSVVVAPDKTVGGMVGYAIGDPGLASAKNNTVNNVKVTGAYNVGGLFGQAQNIDLANNTVKNTEVTSTTALPADAGETEKRVDEVAARQHGHYTETGSTVENVTVNEQ